MLQTALIFGDNMVLQQKKRTVVWGTGDIGRKVTISIQKQTKNAVVQEDGSWIVFLDPLQMSFEETMVICSGEETIVYRHVSVGEVWLAGGQSNMEFYMLFDKNYQQEYGCCENKNIHFFDYPEISYEGQMEDFDYSQMGFWRSCTAEDLKYYSAIAYYFAEKLQRSLEVPIGIIGCNWGGSTASCWMKEDALEKHGRIWIEEYNNELKKIKDMNQYTEAFRSNSQNDRGRPFADPFSMLMLPGLTRKEQLEFMENEDEKKAEGENTQPDAVTGPYSMSRPSGLYHHMLEKISPYGISGVLWYQGESDNIHADIYKELLSDLIDCWRELWKEELPFYIVQLAPYERWLWFKADNFQILRQAQDEIAHEKRKVYLISSSDAGMRFDVHPKRKKPVGERLALAALTEEYGKNFLWKAPEVFCAVRENNRIIITFKNVGDGLYLKGKKMNGVEIYSEIRGEKKKIDRSGWKVSVKREQVIFEVIQPAQAYVVAFAKSMYYRVNLYNSGKIPAVPFEIRVP